MNPARGEECDPPNGGTCDATCKIAQQQCTAIPNATGASSGGSCNYTCTTGFGNCDSQMIPNGCEADLNTNVNNCGGCGFACAFPHAIPGCSNSQCQLVACDMGWFDHDGNAANGCELQTP